MLKMLNNFIPIILWGAVNVSSKIPAVKGSLSARETNPYNFFVAMSLQNTHDSEKCNHWLNTYFFIVGYSLTHGRFFKKDKDGMS